jgi:hypothetical protein
MKKLLVSVVVLFLTGNIQAQTLIATSLCPEATANHNQRKIVRDGLFSDLKYMVYADSLDGVPVIKGVAYYPFTGQWSSPEIITEGCNPTLAISSNGNVHLVFESNDPLPVIRYTSSDDFLQWTPTITISDPLYGSRLPVADVDSSDRLNVLWIQKNDGPTESLMYAGIRDDTVIDRKCIATKDEVEDVAIANHLKYCNNNLIFAIQFNQDSLQFFKSQDHMSTLHSIYEASGSQPCISYNSNYDECFWSSSIRLLYIDLNSQLIEIESGTYSSNFYSHILQPGIIDNVYIDDAGPPLGFSYLFMKSDTLYHGFSFGYIPGPTWWNTILDTIAGNLVNPSIAYKSFNMEFVDFVWMESTDSGYNIYYKQDPKILYLGTDDTEPGKGFSIIGSPNPFTDLLTISIVLEDAKSPPLLQVYCSGLEPIRVLNAESVSANEFAYTWDGANQSGNKVKPGTYFILCTAGDKKAVRKIVFMGN